jgi:2,4-dienoyl-CoA reductase-like NADH-dependent reductase (Old Yellow Enzyme family)
MSCESEQGRLDFPIGYEGGSLESFAITIAEENGAALSSAQIVFKAADSDAAALTLSDGSGLTLTSTAAGGWIITIDQINTIILNGRADLVALGRPLLLDANFVRNAQAYENIPADDIPNPYKMGVSHLYPLKTSERKQIEGMKKALKPKSNQK